MMAAMIIDSAVVMVKSLPSSPPATAAPVPSDAAVRGDCGNTGLRRAAPKLGSPRFRNFQSDGHDLFCPPRSPSILAFATGKGLLFLLPVEPLDGRRDLAEHLVNGVPLVLKLRRQVLL